MNLAWPENSGWLKVNSDEVGFYRVNYDVENWKALIKQLKEDHTVRIHVYSPYLSLSALLDSKGSLGLLFEQDFQCPTKHFSFTSVSFDSCRIFLKYL